MDMWEEARPRPLAAGISHALSDFHNEMSANNLLIILLVAPLQKFLHKMPTRGKQGWEPRQWQGSLFCFFSLRLHQSERWTNASRFERDAILMRSFSPLLFSPLFSSSRWFQTVYSEPCWCESRWVRHLGRDASNNLHSRDTAQEGRRLRRVEREN